MPRTAKPAAEGEDLSVPVDMTSDDVVPFVEDDAPESIDPEFVEPTLPEPEPVEPEVATVDADGRRADQTYFESTDKEPLQFYFAGNKGFRLSDGRVAWRFPHDEAASLLGHEMVMSQRIKLVK